MTISFKKFLLKNKGYTVVEFIVVLAVVILLFTIFIPLFKNFSTKQELNNETEKIISVLRSAQGKTLASEDLEQWGVYFDINSNPHRYILFKGSDYVSRDPLLDEIYNLTQNIQISSIDIGGDTEIIFNRLTGEPNQIGSLTLELVGGSVQSAIIYINQAGQMALYPFLPPSGVERNYDSRHVHVDYNSIIDIATSTSDSLILEFDGGLVTETVIIAENLQGGQLYWEGEVDVAGDIQELIIETHRLNNPDTQFCIHRSRQTNNKSLNINISTETGSTPSLIGFSADGTTVIKGSSFFVSEPVWQ